MGAITTTMVITNQRATATTTILTIVTTTMVAGAYSNINPDYTFHGMCTEKY